MYDTNYRGISYIAGFFMLIAFAVAGLVATEAISNQVWIYMTGKPTSEIVDGITDPANRNAYRVMQVVLNIVGFFLPALITARVLNRKPASLLGYSLRITPIQIGLVLAIMITALFASTGLSYLNEQVPVSPSWKIRFDEMESEYNRQMEAIIGLNSPREFIIALIIMAFLPALCEETLFRGGLQNFLTRSTRLPWLSVIIVSLIFSAVHFSYYGFLSRFFLGVVLGLIYHYSGRLWLAILAHFINNAIVLTVVYVYKMQGMSMKEIMNQGTGSYWGLVALPVVIAFFILFQKVSRQTKKDTIG